MRDLTFTNYSLLNYLKVFWVSGQMFMIQKVLVNIVREYWSYYVGDEVNRGCKDF